MSKVKNLQGEGVRQLNRSYILKQIREQGPITKIALANYLSLTFAAVSNIVADLVKLNVIKEVGYGESEGGRPPVLYDMNWNSIHVIAVDIGVEHISAAEIDLKARVIEETTVDTQGAPLIERVYTVIDQLLERRTNDSVKIAGIGVSAPGPIDARDGRMLTPPNMEGVSNIDIKYLLEDRYGLTTVLEKDANASALAEQWFGHVTTDEDILYIFNDVGLGGGLIINARVHRGFGNGAGEIGHMAIDIDGPRCNCGNFGCLEALSSGIAIQRRVKEEIRRGYPTTLEEAFVRNEKALTIDLIINHAKQGDQLAKHILDEAGRYLGLGVANAINLFAPDQVIFGGSVTVLYPEMIKIAEHVAKQRTFSPFSERITFAQSKFHKQSNLVGAAAVIQQRLFDYPEGAFFLKVDRVVLSTSVH
ncbi:ROK family protein [Lentibacillus saliphilus]|uniref:ROK family protein n=1 Tax=Lentibacillus saliphilus TaxID=2737028 RepID=UPI001C30509F|nr:ROK family protein [Lentibacillus saliphilus]